MNKKVNKQENNKFTRVVFSKDIHKLLPVKKETLISLGGCQFKSNYKIVAHSDGDLILHTISSCFLACASLDDLGIHFPDNKKQTKNIDSKKILSVCYNKMNNNFVINNLDLTLVCDKIMFNSKAKKIVESISKLLKITKNKISFKATRYENDSKMIECNCIGSFICK